MVFMNGRGRPPTPTAEVGSVSWQEDKFCFVGSNGFYWHGTKFGGWQTEPPEVSPEQRKRPATSGRGRRPNGNDRVGIEVSYNAEHDCYQTDKKYYWHGTFQGGWKKNLPGTEVDVATEPESSDNENHNESPTKKQKKGNTKGRPPRHQTHGELIEYDEDKLCWKSDREGGIYWHGTYNGGWKAFPPHKK